MTLVSTWGTDKAQNKVRSIMGLPTALCAWSGSSMPAGAAYYQYGGIAGFRSLELSNFADLPRVL